MRSMAQVVVLVLAMRKKLLRAPMQALLRRLRECGALRVVVLDDAGMARGPEKWPVAHVLVPLVSGGFPLERARAYARLRRPVVVNDLGQHATLRDRLATRAVLAAHGVPLAKGVCFDPDAGDVRTIVADELRVYDAMGRLRGALRKPFVEKPTDADDHDVYIYYARGGARRLHRKVGNRSSQYLPQVTRPRMGGAFLYEQFHAPAMCADVKVYAAGDYFYAEARKAPHIDGFVERDEAGLEKRTRVVLSDDELRICEQVVRAFGQFMNGFDLLRTKEGRTFVIDVNGWSFSKRDSEFAPNSAQKLIRFILDAHSPRKPLVRPLSVARPNIDASPATTAA